jgi:tetratricopeptide (TPR) repeat protein
MYGGELEKAIGVFDEIEEKTGVSRELSIQKERLYLKLGKTDKAATELENLIAADPSDMYAYSLLVDLYQANDMDDKALETIERMKKVNPESPHVFLALAEYYRSQGDTDKSFGQLKRAFRSDRLDADIKLRIIGSYYPLVRQDEKMMAQALELGKILAEVHPSEPMPLTAYAEFLTLAGRYEEANAQYKRVLELDQSNENVWQQYISNTEQLRDFETMLHATEEAMELFPNNPIYYLYNGLAKSGMERYEDAVSVLEAGVKVVVDNDAMLADFYDQLGNQYHEMGRDDESDRSYDKALEYDPSKAYTLNNYAYYLSLRKVKLEKAAKMSLRSNELMPGQASFEDTYAWIKYQQGDYAEAKEWLEKALDHGGDNSGTILEHYGDVLYKLNDVTGAVEYWQKARVAGDGSELLDKKIAEQKLYE